eukprot:m.1730 g.1730  ORF g.1730 m.1730 type:complete len:64 (-) comp1657_c0_seq1:1-192(-)
MATFSQQSNLRQKKKNSQTNVILCFPTHDQYKILEQQVEAKFEGAVFLPPPFFLMLASNSNAS